MTIAKVAATIRCDGCAAAFEITLDAAHAMAKSQYESLDQYVDDMIRAGDALVFSIQGSHQLCAKCTRVVDDAYPEVEPHRLSYDQVSGALNKAAGV
jgi:hypothetical protein